MFHSAFIFSISATLTLHHPRLIACDKMCDASVCDFLMFSLRSLVNYLTIGVSYIKVQMPSVDRCDWACIQYIYYYYKPY